MDGRAVGLANFKKPGAFAATQLVFEQARRDSPTPFGGVYGEVQDFAFPGAVWRETRNPVTVRFSRRAATMQSKSR